MSKQTIYLSIAVTVCTIFLFGFTAFYFHRAQNSICTATEKSADKAEQVSGDMLWESLSRQFVSSVQF